jgi:hypothetical protein
MSYLDLDVLLQGGDVDAGPRQAHELLQMLCCFRLCEVLSDVLRKNKHTRTCDTFTTPRYHLLAKKGNTEHAGLQDV